MLDDKQNNQNKIWLTQRLTNFGFRRNEIHRMPVNTSVWSQWNTLCTTYNRKH